MTIQLPILFIQIDRKLNNGKILRWMRRRITLKTRQRMKSLHLNSFRKTGTRFQFPLSHKLKLPQRIISIRKSKHPLIPFLLTYPHVFTRGLFHLYLYRSRIQAHRNLVQFLNLSTSQHRLFHFHVNLRLRRLPGIQYHQRFRILPNHKWL